MKMRILTVLSVREISVEQGPILMFKETSLPLAIACHGGGIGNSILKLDNVTASPYALARRHPQPNLCSFLLQLHSFKACVDLSIIGSSMHAFDYFIDRILCSLTLLLLC